MHAETSPDAANPMNFEGSVVLVTGGTKGIGRSIAQRFADLGASVAVSARNAAEDLPADWHFVAADLRDGDEAAGMVDQVVDRFGRIDVAINNAGGAPPADTATASHRFTERVVQLNLLSSIYVAQQANHHMQAADGGSIINIGSVTAMRPAPTVAAYGAAKAGLLNFTRTTGQEWAPAVRVNCITAGLVRTEQAAMHYGDNDAIERIERAIPMRRMATPHDIANACVYFASPLSSYVTGANLVLDGGGDLPAFLVDREG